MRKTFKKEERIRSRKVIETLFSTGSSFTVFPFKVIYVRSDNNDDQPAKVLISVPKKNFKSAVKRNKIKRHIREAYRNNKSIIWEFVKSKDAQHYNIGIVYIGKTIVPAAEFDKKLIIILHRLIEKDVKNNR